MNPAAPEHIAMLRSIRGSVPAKTSASLADISFVTLFMIVLPGLLIYALLHHGLPGWPLAVEEIAIAALIPLSSIIGCGLLFRKAAHYEVTGSGVALRRGRKTIHTMDFQDIEKIDLVAGERGTSRLIVEAKGTRFDIPRASSVGS